MVGKLLRGLRNLAILILVAAASYGLGSLKLFSPTKSTTYELEAALPQQSLTIAGRDDCVEPTDDELRLVQAADILQQRLENLSFSYCNEVDRPLEQ